MDTDTRIEELIEVLMSYAADSKEEFEQIKSKAVKIADFINENDLLGAELVLAIFIILRTHINAKGEGFVRYFATMEEIMHRNSPFYAEVKKNTGDASDELEEHLERIKRCAKGKSDIQ